MSRITFDTTGLAAAASDAIKEGLFIRLESDTITQPSDITKANIEQYLEDHLKEMYKGHKERSYKDSFTHTPPDLS